MIIIFFKHFINLLLTFRALNLDNIYEKLKPINRLAEMMKNFIQMFKNVNKSHVLQHKF